MMICLLVLMMVPTVYAADYDQERWDYENWMTDTWHVIKDVRYADLVYSGTHDAGTYDLQKYNPRQISQILEEIYGYVPDAFRGLYNDYLEPITKVTSMTQDVNVRTQLFEGNRFLDLRFKRYKDEELRIFHGMFGDTIDEIIDQVEEYLENSSDKEIIFINLNRYGELWDMPDGDFEEVGEKFQEELGSYIFTDEEFDFTMTMEELVATGKRLVVNAGNDSVAVHLEESMEPNFSILQAQKGSLHLKDVVIPALRDKYEDNYANTTNTSKLNQPYQIKLQIGFKFEEGIEPIVDKLKDGDVVGAERKFEDLKKKSLKKYTLPYQQEIDNFMKELGSDEDDNQPNIWMRDFYTKGEISNAIVRNLGQSYESRQENLNSLYEAKLAGDVEAGKAYELFRKALLAAGELHYSHAREGDYFKTPLHGAYGGSKEFSILNQSGISRITLHTGRLVDGIEITYNDGTTKLEGKKGGSESTIKLDGDEYINSVRLRKGSEIDFIMLKTNKGQVVYGGGNGGDSATIAIPEGWKLAGIFGRCGDRTDELGLYIAPVLNYEPSEVTIKSTSQYGGYGGEGFNLFAHGDTRLSELRVRSGERIDAIKTIFTNGQVKKVGGNGGSEEGFKLFEGEYFISAIVTSGSRIDYMQLATNYGRRFEAGHRLSNDRVVSIPEGWYIDGFYGRADNEVDGIGFILKKLPEGVVINPNGLKYTITYGGSGGDAFEHFSLAKDYKITELRIRSGNRVDGLTVKYSNGSTASEGKGGNEKKIKLVGNEYITHVEVSYGERVDYLRFTTNKGQMLSGGKHTSNTRTVPIPKGWYVAGLLGRSADEIDQIGFILKELPEGVPHVAIKTSNSYGGNGGDSFNFSNDMVKYNLDKPTQIKIESGSRIDGIRVSYGSRTLQAGGDAHTSTLNLDDNEYITRAVIRTGSRVDRLELYTNKGHSIKGGKDGGSRREINPPDGWYIAGFFGREGDEIDRIGFIFKPIASINSGE